MPFPLERKDYVIELASPGTQTAGIKDIGLLPFDASLVAIIALAGTAGVTGSQITDVHSITASGAGATIFANAAKITYSGSVVVGSLNAADLVAPKQYTAGTLFAMENDSVHTTGAVHQKVLLVFRRRGRIPAVLINTVAGLAVL